MALELILWKGELAVNENFFAIPKCFLPCKRQTATPEPNYIVFIRFQYCCFLVESKIRLHVIGS